MRDKRVEWSRDRCPYTVEEKMEVYLVLLRGVHSAPLSTMWRRCGSLSLSLSLSFSLSFKPTQLALLIHSHREANGESQDKTSLGFESDSLGFFPLSFFYPTRRRLKIDTHIPTAKKEGEGEGEGEVCVCERETETRRERERGRGRIFFSVWGFPPDKERRAIWGFIEKGIVEWICWLQNAVVGVSLVGPCTWSTLFFLQTLYIEVVGL